MYEVFPTPNLTPQKERELSPEQSYDRQFSRMRESLSHLLGSFSNTEAGKGIDIDSSLESYPDYTKLPVITSLQISKNPKRFVNDQSGDLQGYNTGGSSGSKKIIYRSKKGYDIDLPQVVKDDLDAFEHPVLVHKGLRGSQLYRLADKYFTDNHPKAAIEGYNDIDGFIEAVRNNDYVYMMEVVVRFKEFYHSLKNEFEAHPEKFEALKGKVFTADLSASRVTIDELAEWHTLLTQIFGEKIFLDVTYGLSEVGEMATYLYQPGDHEMRYRVWDTAFVEVFDPETGQPVLGKEGDVIISNHLEDEGTILPRYLSGDTARLEINEAGVAFLIEPGRKPEQGMLDIRGKKIFAPDVLKALTSVVDFPIRIIISHETVEDFSSDKITIGVVSEYGANLSYENILKLRSGFLLEYPFKTDSLKLEIFGIDEDLETPVKDWSIKSKL